MITRNISDKNNRERFRKITGAKCRFVFASCLCVLFFGAVGLIYPVQFGNDDMGFMYIYAGYASGTPEPYSPFNLIPWGYMISSLYSLLPSLPWYAFAHIGVMFMSCVAITYCVMDVTNRFTVPFAVGLMFSLVFLCVFALRNIIWLQWTTTAGFAGAAALSSAVTFEPSDKAKEYSVLRCTAITLSSIFSFIIRDSVFYIVAIFLVGIFALKMFQRRKIVFQFLQTLIMIAACAVCLIIVQRLVENTPETRDFLEFNHERALTMDYASLNLVAGEEVGITNNELNAIKGWCFLTEHMSTKLFQTINKLAAARRPAPTFSGYTEQLNNMLSSLAYGIQYRIFSGLFLLSVFLGYIKNKKRKFTGVYTLGGGITNYTLRLCALISFYGCCSYLTLSGRFPERVLNMLILLFAPYIIMDLCALSGDLIKKNKRIMTATLYALAFVALWYVTRINITELKANAYKQNGLNTVMVTYAMEHPENLYMYDVTLSRYTPSPFKVYRESKPTNLMFYGGWAYNSSIWRKQLQRNGLDKFDMYSFRDDSVYLMSTAASSFFTIYAEEFFRTAGGYTFQTDDAVMFNNQAIYILKCKRPSKYLPVK